MLRKLINRGQIELVIAHYSDQFFIGYPALDLKKSIEISDKILAAHGMKRSRVFFGQEIQWTPAYASALKDKYDLVVTSSDPHSYYRDKTLPLVNVRYGNDQILGLIGAGEKKLDGLEWDCSVEHMAATWRQKEQKLVFREELNENNPGMKMHFYVVKGDVNAGLKFENSLNTRPTYYLKIEDKQLKYEKVIPQ